MMKAQQVYGLRPFSLAVTALVRGSAGLKSTQSRFHLVTTPCFAAVPSCSSLSLPSTCAPKIEAHESPDASDIGKATTWDIPWGNPETKRQKNDTLKYTLTRTLKTIPGEELHSDDISSNDGDSFRVMSFNILAQAMATSKAFTYVPKGQLKKNVRWRRVRDEICRYGADIICLQECDAFSDILAALRKAGEPQGSLFDGIYKRRAGIASGHGVAIFFDSKVFRLLDSGSCELKKDLLGMVSAFALLQDRRRGTGSPSSVHVSGDIPANEVANAEPDYIGDAVDVAHCGEGRIREPGGRWADVDPEACGMVCVVTTHLYWHPQGSGVRLAQTEALMQNVEAFLRERFGDRYSSVPVVLAGDLNNVPGVDVYRLLLTGVCEGESPEAFAKRRKEIDAARMTKRLEDFRKAEKAAGNMAAKRAAVRRKNADLIASKVHVTLTHAAATTAASSAAVEPDREESVVCVPGGVGIIANEGPAKSAAEGRGYSVSVSDTEDENGEPDMEGVFNETDREEEIDTEGGGDGSGVRGDAVSDSVGVEGEVDVRDYRQAFKGLKSAYSAYYSVFGSQLPEGFHNRDTVTCKTTGRVTIGHLHLGAREASAGRGRGGDLSSGDPHLTTCTDKFAGTLDYIWQTPQLSVRALLDLPTLDQAMQGGGLPTMTYPSDHLSIMAELRWRHRRDALDAPSRQ